VNSQKPLQTLPPWKRRLFLAITISLPLVVLLVAEMLLRIFGWGGYPAAIRRIGTLPSGATLCIVEPTASTPYFFANPTRPGYAEQSNFVMPKPADTLRIFLIGESAAKGYPQPRNLAMSVFLQAMLADLLPQKNIEVINLGTTAIASFPLIYQVRDALKFDPDLFIFYLGNNEFFGAYGTASINSVGATPSWALPLMRAARGLALVQAVEGLVRSGTDENRTLMEQMIGQTMIAADSPLRDAAAHNLFENLSRMLQQVNAQGVPALVCTTASNEAGLAPLGEEDLAGLGRAERVEFQRLLAAVRAAELTITPTGHSNATPSNAPTSCAATTTAVATDAITMLRLALTLAPRSANAQFELGKAFAAAGDATSAQQAFLKARDFDTMPWRPIRQTEQAIRDAAAANHAVLCDIAEKFRQRGPEPATSWQLLDDHVHLSLLGQAEAARAMVQCMSALSGALAVDAAAAEELPDFSMYAQRLGSNPFDTYRVNHTLRTLFGVSFMKRNNAHAFERYETACKNFEATLSPALRETAREWQSSRPHAGGLRPLCAMVARVLLRENNPAEALPLYELAQAQVPSYTSWHLEYIYFALACREKLNGLITEQDRAQAASGIAEGKFLLAHGFSETGLTERYIGRLHQLRGEWSEAIPFLLSARPRMSAEDLVACDQALFLSYIKTGNTAAALNLVDDGIQKSGRFSHIYQQLRKQLKGG